MLTDLVCTAGRRQRRHASRTPGHRQPRRAPDRRWPTSPPPLNTANPGITCTFTNTYTPRATLTLVKSVSSGTATPNLWTLTATGSAAAPPSGADGLRPVRFCCGHRAARPGRHATSSPRPAPARRPPATSRSVPGRARRPAGRRSPSRDGAVTLPDAAASPATANVTCTATNRLATGSLRISKVVDDPNGGYTGGTSQTFSGTYNCGTGSTGTFTTLTTATPVTIAGIPAGRTCTVTETHADRRPAQRLVRLGDADVQHAAGHDRRPGHRAR